MPFLETDIYSCVLSYTVSGNRLSTKVSYGATGTPPNDVCADLADEFFSTVVGPWAAAVSQDVHFQDVYCFCEAAGTRVPQRKPIINLAGSIGVDSIPSNLMAILQLRQVEEPSRHNGRLYVGGVSEGDVTDSLITGAAAAAHWADLIAALNTQIGISGGTTMDIITIQRVAAGVPITPVGLVVGQIALNRSLGSLRRRTTELREVHP